MVRSKHMLEVRHTVKDVCGPRHPKVGMMFYATVGINHKHGKLTATNVWADIGDVMKMILYCLKRERRSVCVMLDI